MRVNKFLKLSTWSMIINSRLIAYKNSKEPWCKERREICKNCIDNSKFHPPETFKDYFWRFLNAGKDYCRNCFCGIKAKTRVKRAVCGREEVGLEPLWIEIK